MPYRTFDIDCPLDTAADELPMPPEHVFSADSYHPAALDPNTGNVILCVHDDANDGRTLVTVPKAVVTGFEDRDDAFQVHLERVINAELN